MNIIRTYQVHKQGAKCLATQGLSQYFRVRVCKYHTTAAVVCVLQEHTHAWARGGGGVAVSVTADWVIHKTTALQ